MLSRYQLDASTNWAVKPHVGSEANFSRFFVSIKKSDHDQMK